MEKSQDEGSSHVRTEDLLAPPPMGRALSFAGLAAIAGAAIWGLLLIYGRMEHGAVAWGIGGLIGFAIIKAGGHGQTLSIAGAVLAVLSIAAGKQICYQSEINEAIDSGVQQEAPHYEEALTDAAAWAALGDSPNDDAVVEFALDHNFDVDDANQLRVNFAAGMERITKEQPSREQWLEWKRTEHEEFASHFTFLDYLKGDTNPFDLLFLGLGIATAFGMVHKQTIALQQQAREELRAERAVEQQVEPDE